MQIAMLKQLLFDELITEREYITIKNKLMMDYQVISDLTS